jgi:hypothetical protein
VPPPDAHPHPDWLKVKFFGGQNYQDLKSIMRTLGLHTVCERARCDAGRRPLRLYSGQACAQVKQGRRIDGQGSSISY